MKISSALKQLLFLVFPILLLTWVITVVITTQTGIEVITCTGCTEGATNLLQTLQGKTLLTVGRVSIQEVLTPHDLTLLTYTKELPHSLFIEVAANPPIYAVELTSLAKTWKVTTTGLRVETATLDNLPLFILMEDIDHTRLQNALPFFEYQPDKRITIMNKHWAELDLDKGSTIIFNPSEPTSQKQVLEFVLNNWESIPQGTKEIDIRFKSPITRKERTKPSDAWTIQEKVASVSAEIASPSAGL